MDSERLAEKIDRAENSLPQTKEDVLGFIHRRVHRLEQLGGEKAVEAVIKKLDQKFDCRKTPEGFQYIHDGEVRYEIKGEILSFKDIQRNPEVDSATSLLWDRIKGLKQHMENIVFIKNPVIVFPGQEISISDHDYKSTYIFYEINDLNYQQHDKALSLYVDTAHVAKADINEDYVLISLPTAVDSILNLFMILHEIGHSRITDQDSSTFSSAEVRPIYGKVQRGENVNPAEAGVVLEHERLANDFAKRVIAGEFYDLVSEEDLMCLEAYNESSYAQGLYSQLSA